MLTFNYDLSKYTTTSFYSLKVYNESDKKLENLLKTFQKSNLVEEDIRTIVDSLERKDSLDLMGE